MNGSQFWELYQSYGDVYRQEVINEEVELDEVTGGGLIKGSSTSYAGATPLNPKTGKYENNLSAAQKRREKHSDIIRKQVRGDIKPEPGTSREIQAQRLAGFRKPQQYRGGDVPKRDPGAYESSHEGISPKGTPSGLAMTPKARAESRAKSLEARGGKYTRAANRIRREVETNKNLNASYDYDLYDLVLEYLLDEGYAETPEDATVIMANMSEQWFETIVEGSEDSAVAGELARLRTQMRTALQKGDTATIQSISKRLADLQPAARAKTGAALKENAEALAEYDRRRKAAELAGDRKKAEKYTSIMGRIEQTIRASQKR